MTLSKLLACFGVCAGLSGCASTKVATSGMAAKQPLCQTGGERLSALVLWGPVWRANQKSPLLREAAAQRGLEQFFAGSGCFSKVRTHRLSGEGPAVVPSDREALALAATENPAPDRALIITVRELGPVIRLGLPTFVEGGTEAVLEIKAFDVHTGERMANFHTHWQNGGAFVIKGVRTLEQDMTSALEAALAPAARAR